MNVYHGQKQLTINICHSTKTLIEDYMEEMVKQIEYIEATDALDQQAKMKFFSDARQGFGCSALVLQGGTAFGKDRW